MLKFLILCAVPVALAQNSLLFPVLKNKVYGAILEKESKEGRMDDTKPSLDLSTKKSSNTTLASFGTSKSTTNSHAPRTCKSSSVSH